jgi:serine/threonine-protein phosphatase 6 regulatory subunit 3
VFPPEDADYKRGHKYPFIASELFACESLHIINQFFYESILLIRLFDFLNSDQINPTLAGYFSKLLICLLNKNPSTIIDYIEYNRLIPKLTEKINNRSISNLVTKILAIESSQKDFYLKARSSLLSSLIARINYENVSDTFLQEIIFEFFYRFDEINSWKELVKVMTSSENMMLIIETSLCDNQHRVFIGANILKNILDCSGCDFLYKTKTDLESLDDLGASEFLEWVFEALKNYENVLKRPSSSFRGTLHTEFPALGKDRLKIIELVNSCIKLNIKELNNFIASIGILQEIILIFFKFEFNSMVHNQVSSLISSLLIYSQDENLLETLIKKTELIKRISTHTGNKGYSGHVIKIANQLIMAQNKYDCIIETIELCEEWPSFVNEYLDNQNIVQKITLGEEKKKSVSTDKSLVKTEEMVSQFFNKITGNHYKDLKKTKTVDSQTDTNDKDNIIQETLEEGPIISHEDSNETPELIKKINDYDNFIESKDLKIPEDQDKDFELDFNLLQDEKIDILLENNEENILDAQPELTQPQVFISSFTQEIKNKFEDDDVEYWRFGPIN